MSMRLKTWNKIASAWKLERLELLTTEITLEGLNERIDLILERKHKGCNGQIKTDTGLSHFPS